jgi:phage pi2 protein 07
MTCIYLPTSIGEAIDKLTILDIKLERISDIARKADVQREHDALLNDATLTDFIQIHADLYNTMKKANAIIWDMMDVLRTDISTEEYLKICKDCIEFNDIRFRIKARINQASNSELREQKSYKTTVFKLAIIGMRESHADISTVQRILQRPLQYYGILYDEVQMTTADDGGANVIVNLNDFSHIMTDETQLKQCIYDALKVSDAVMDKLL